jgi:putative flippase GtrA
MSEVRRLDWRRFGSRATRADELARLARYVAVGVATNCFALGLYYVLTFGFRMEPKAALTLAALAAFGPAYAANRAWTFRVRTRHASSLWRYAAGYLGSFVCQAAFLALGVDGLGLRHEYVVVVGLALATVLFFLLQRIWVFGTDHVASPGKLDL